MPKSCFASLLDAARFGTTLSVAGLALVSAWAGGSLASSPGNVSSAGLPLFFEAGISEAPQPASFVARGPRYQLLVTPTEVNFAFRQGNPDPPRSSFRREELVSVQSAPSRLMRMAFLSANPQARLSGGAPMEGKVNYLIGNDPSRWRAQLPVFSQVAVAELYPGIDVVYYGNHNQVEYDFTIAPHADPAAIRFRLDGADAVRVEASGELVVQLDDAELRQHQPVIYQVVRGVRHEISGGYRLSDSRTVSFVLGPYDRDWPLIIDPVFSYSSFFGGNAGDTGLTIKVDASGSVYLAGETLSTKFPAAQNTAPFQSQMHGGVNTGDAFVAKLDSTGSKLVYLTYLGGSGDDGAYDMAIDASGNAYVAGFTVSPDFPTHNALFPHISGSADPTFNLYPIDGFVAELNASGSALVYSTYLGGTDKDLVSGIAVDPAGNAYVIGYTYSTNFPLVNPLQSSLAGSDDVFVAKLAAGGKSLVYSTYLGGRSIDEGEGIAVDAAGSAWVTGYTASTNFPVTLNAAQTKLNGSGSLITVFDAFVTKLAPNGRSLAYSTYLGGSENDLGYRIALDQLGNAFITGTTQSPDFSHTNAFGLRLGENGTNAINFDAFLVKVSPAGKPVYAAQFGGTGNDVGWDVAVDPAGRPFVIGITQSTNFPVVHPFDLFRSTNSGSRDVFVVAFEADSVPVLYSAYLGGGADDFGYAIAVDPESNAYISGMTLSKGFPITRPIDPALGGARDAFVAKIRLMDPQLSVVQTGTSFQLTWPATAPDYVLQSSPDLTPPQVWTNVSQSPVLSDGQYTVNLNATNSLTVFRLFRP